MQKICWYVNIITIEVAQQSETLYSYKLIDAEKYFT